MEKLYKVAKIIAYIAIGVFIFAQSLGVEAWKWAILSIGAVCVVVMGIIEYKKKIGLFAGTNWKKRLIFPVALVALLAGTLIYLSTSGSSEWIGIAIIVYLLIIMIYSWYKMKE